MPYQTQAAAVAASTRYEWTWVRACNPEDPRDLHITIIVDDDAEYTLPARYCGGDDELTLSLDATRIDDLRAYIEGNAELRHAAYLEWLRACDEWF